MFMRKARLVTPAQSWAGASDLCRRRRVRRVLGDATSTTCAWP